MFQSDYNYFIKDGINIGNQPDGLGNDILINICEWTTPVSN